ncbi:glutamyl-tRNA reductase [Actinomycetospora sp. NBRC 106375]|uniref:glutamyl-tRNA reductase n=1 Tax=Actinomycetospora sp. NBRC 106375 TaxID=3032207 RepID=UPI0024A34EE2|nr:glutamyl-tRNA reductase [Actinomycetospora sp. NBRC 106375]GLZ44792.1 glutamyl-tRNA reductase [Actinomycetospora sp. NBRC 106375]
MSVLLVGVSHRTAEVPVLERVAVSAEDTRKVLDDLLTGEHVTEAMLVSTCNRVEIYAVVETFHGGLTEVSSVLARHAHAEVSDLTDHLYVHYAGSAVEHLFSVAAGLDSMVVGEAQILGQLRASYNEARELGSAGKVLHELAQQALRVGKRAHTETGIDAAGASVVSEVLADAEDALGGPGSLAGRRALVVGAGSMGALSAAHLRRGGVDDLVLANRSEENAERLAVALRGEGATARAAGLDALPAEIAAADVVVACTGAIGTVIGEDAVRRALAGRAPTAAPLVVCDLGLPRDVDPRVAALPGVTVVDLAALGERLRSASAGIAVEQARTVVAEEVRAYFAAQRTAEVTPTVTALRRRAAEVVDAELLRLAGRLPDLDDRSRDEVAQTVRRVVDKLLHTPTVQVKRLAQAPGGDTYAEALRELFELDPQTPAVLAATETTRVEPGERVDQALAVDPHEADHRGGGRR